MPPPPSSAIFNAAKGSSGYSWVKPELPVGVLVVSITFDIYFDCPVQGLTWLRGKKVLNFRKTAFLNGFQ